MKCQCHGRSGRPGPGKGQLTGWLPPPRPQARVGPGWCQCGTDPTTHTPHGNAWAGLGPGYPPMRPVRAAGLGPGVYPGSLCSGLDSESAGVSAQVEACFASTRGRDSDSGLRSVLLAASVAARIRRLGRPVSARAETFFRLSRFLSTRRKTTAAGNPWRAFGGGGGGAVGGRGAAEPELRSGWAQPRI